ncbi:7111_t:CDS:2 [Paraglomus brasilianum]|uniref:7111_t:CDS:1 n=1 Tax=Paraglomus brasilianum TaxID=144538 RepID=A0A9N9C3S2_9GLOM|nr:7111_t:CDS:2 [Paraglomus brasilianum]
MRGKNYANKGVRVLNEARFRSSDEVISKRYPKDQASGNEDASHKRPDRNGLSQTPWIQMSRTFLTCGEVVSRASWDRRANAVDAPSNAEGYHLDWMFTVW